MTSWYRRDGGTLALVVRAQPGAVALVAGARSREKRFEIAGSAVDPEELLRAVSARGR